MPFGIVTCTFSDNLSRNSCISGIWPAGSHFCKESYVRFRMTINRVTLQHNKEFIMVIFYLMVFSMCNLQKRLIRAAF